MKGLSITSRGIEDIVCLELKDLLKTPGEKFENCVSFTVKNLKELVSFVYMSQSSERVLLLLNQGKISELTRDIDKINFTDFKNKTFKIVCKNFDDGLDPDGVIEDVASILLKKLKSKVDLTNPDIVFYIYMSDEIVFFGIDLCGFDLNKRQYRVFPHQTSLRSTIAYSLLRLANYKEKNKLLDPFCGSGTIPIEAAHYFSKISIHFFQKNKFLFNKLGDFSKIFENIDNKQSSNELPIIGYDAFMGCIIGSRKNAKIAGVEKLIHFSKIELSWLDTKLEEGEIDIIVTHPPEPSKTKDEKDLIRTYKEFFHQVEFVLNKRGKIVTICRDNTCLKEVGSEYKIKLDKEIKVNSGQQSLIITIFSPTSS